MPRRYFTYMPGTGLELGNFISTIGALGMSIGTLIFVANIIITTVRAVPAAADPWDGRTLEWSISSPPPEYNFAQSPLVRGIDALWIEKTAGNKNITPAEPLGDIHMPSPTILPLIMGSGFFIIGLGLCLHSFIGRPPAFTMAGVGLAIVLGSMLTRSLIDDHGYHIHADEIKDGDKGVKA